MISRNSRINELLWALWPLGKNDCVKCVQRLWSIDVNEIWRIRKISEKSNRYHLWDRRGHQDDLFRRSRPRQFPTDEKEQQDVLKRAKKDERFRQELWQFSGQWTEYQRRKKLGQTRTVSIHVQTTPEGHRKIRITWVVVTAEQWSKIRFNQVSTFWVIYYCRM